MKPRPSVPLAVYKADGTWRWNCRSCSRSDWRGRHQDAFADAHRHLSEHTTFGFRR